MSDSHSLSFRPGLSAVSRSSESKAPVATELNSRKAPGLPSAAGLTAGQTQHHTCCASHRNTRRPVSPARRLSPAPILTPPAGGQAGAGTRAHERAPASGEEAADPADAARGKRVGAPRGRAGSPVPPARGSAAWAARRPPTRRLPQGGPGRRGRGAGPASAGPGGDARAAGGGSRAPGGRARRGGHGAPARGLAQSSRRRRRPRRGLQRPADPARQRSGPWSGSASGWAARGGRGRPVGYLPAGRRAGILGPQAGPRRCPKLTRPPSWRHAWSSVGDSASPRMDVPPSARATVHSHRTS
ncbi:uncharacterized protein LOC118146666 [Callithrix jacchus]